MDVVLSFIVSLLYLCCMSLQNVVITSAGNPAPFFGSGRMPPASKRTVRGCELEIPPPQRRRRTDCLAAMHSSQSVTYIPELHLGQCSPYSGSRRRTATWCTVSACQIWRTAFPDICSRNLYFRECFKVMSAAFPQFGEVM
jgi:hypothetical protein